MAAGSAGCPPQVLQGLHVRILCHVPDLDTTVVGATVQLVCALAEGQALWTDGHGGSGEGCWGGQCCLAPQALWPMLQLTETASRCPVKMCRRLHVAVSQIMISLFLSPVAWQTAGDA